MNRFILVLFLFEVSVCITLAQITFTREWVTGKRSATANAILRRREPCVSFMPTIELLMDIEESQRRECGGGIKFAAFKASGQDGAAGILVKGEEPFEPGTTFGGKA